ncbi:MAG: BMC domain-containing protein [Candidatus Zixiibacteriota bacterium]
MSGNALGLIETKTLSGALEAFDAATKSGEVVIASAEPTENGHVTVKIEGTWLAVKTAMEAGARAAERAGELVSLHVIPRSANEVKPILPYGRFLTRFSPDGKIIKPVEKPKPKTPPAKPSVKKETLKPMVEPKVSGQPPRPRPESVFNPVPEPKNEPVVAPSSVAQSGIAVDFKELEALPVVKLRQYARSIPNLPIQGRQISMANKQQLLEAIKAVADGTSADTLS